MKRQLVPSQTTETGSHILRSLAKTLRETQVTELERTRCLRELDLILRRLITREYKQSNFSPRNLLTIPDRTDELCKDLRFFWSVGAIWEKILEEIGLEDSATVLDIGCGFFPKVELGLYYRHFRGQVTLLDPCPEALKQAYQFLKFFQVKFKVNRKVSSIWEPTGSRFDLIVANHVLDDLLLDSIAQERGIETIETYRSERLFAELWSNISSRPQLGTELMDRLAGVIAQSLNPGGRIVFLDYPSFSHRVMGLMSVYQYVNNCQAELKAFLTERGILPFRVLPNTKLRRERLVIRTSNILCARRTE